MRINLSLVFLVMTFFLVVSVPFIYSPIANASQNREKERLALMAEQLSALIEVAEALEQEQNRSAAANHYPKFQYLTLKQDLVKVRQGINQYVKSVLNSTRDIQPLVGHYTIERAP